MKTEFSFYKSQFAPFKSTNLIPRLRCSKNVQGWSFIQTFTATWFRYAATLWIIKRSDLSIDRNLAHDQNVAKYLR